MKCDKHPENDVISVCVSCGKKLCQDCDFIFNNKHYCEDCKENPLKEEEIQISTKKKSAKTKIDILTIIAIIWGVITGLFTMLFLLILGIDLVNPSSSGNSTVLIIGIIWLLVFIAPLTLIIIKIKDMKKKKDLIH